MSKNKRPNPAHAEGITSQAWIFAARTLHKDTFMYHNDAMAAASAIDPCPTFQMKVENYRRELSSLTHNKRALYGKRIIDRLPIRETLRQVPFYLRPHYKKADWQITDDSRFIPDIDFAAVVKAAAKYGPYELMKSDLHTKRHKMMKSCMKDLIRWPETLDINRSTYTVTKNFDDFLFKVTTAEEGNKLPHIKRNDDIFITARGPREFFDQVFWGLGSHLVVRILNVTKEDGISIIQTLSCDREDLYVLNQPNVLKIRYYVQKGHCRGTGLTQDAAIRSMEYFMGKDLITALGA